MEISLIQEKLVEALNELFERDPYLIEKDLHERSITHRLAIYLEGRFPEYNVDCEYNGNVEEDSGKKYIYLLKASAEALGLLKKDEQDKEVVERAVYPDIIVHKRGLNGPNNNLLIVEVKKSSNDNEGDYDKEKVVRYTSAEHENNLRYSLGAFVYLKVRNEIKFSVEWYVEGQRLE